MTTAQAFWVARWLAVWLTVVALAAFCWQEWQSWRGKP